MLEHALLHELSRKVDVVHDYFLFDLWLFLADGLERCCRKAEVRKSRELVAVSGLADL